MLNISEKIKTIRKTKGLSQQDVADKLFMNRVQYTRIETGKSEPTVTILSKIADALSVDMLDFFKDDNAFDINSYEKSIVEKIQLIEQLDDKQKNSIFTFIDTAISNKRMKDNLQAMVAL